MDRPRCPVFSHIATLIFGVLLVLITDTVPSSGQERAPMQPVPFGNERAAQFVEQSGTTLVRGFEVGGHRGIEVSLIISNNSEATLLFVNPSECVQAILRQSGATGLTLTSRSIRPTILLDNKTRDADSPTRLEVQGYTVGGVPLSTEEQQRETLTLPAGQKIELTVRILEFTRPVVTNGKIDRIEPFLVLPGAYEARILLNLVRVGTPEKSILLQSEFLPVTLR